MDDPALSPGDVVAASYRIDELVGRGAMGAVYAARRIADGERVAIKVLHPKHLRETQVLERFVREARVAAKLSSPHAVRVHDVGMHDSSVPFFSMELLQGVDLQRHVQRAGALSLARAVDYLMQACHAVAEAHSLGVVHRDLKPANLFLTREPDGTEGIKVIDFGVSKLLRPIEGDGDATATTVVVGTPAFMAPEQMRSSKVDARADVWALGATLFFLLTGERPFQGDTIVKIYEGILRGPPSLHAFDPSLPTEIDALVKRALVWSPDERLASVSAFADALAPFASAPGSERMPLPFGPADAALETELIDPALSLSDIPADASRARVPSPWRRQAPRIAVALAVVALALGSYALGASQQARPSAAQLFAGSVIQLAGEIAERAGATPADEDAVVAETADPKSASPLRPSPLRTAKPPLAPPATPKKGDAVWGMP